MLLINELEEIVKKEEYKVEHYDFAGGADFKRLVRELRLLLNNYTNVRSLIVTNHCCKWNIDGRLYESEMYIPEIIRDKKVVSYVLQDNYMIVQTEK